MNNIPSKYNPKEFEEKIYNIWMEENCFRAEVNPDKKPFTIVMPPPNITGQLHMGHALDMTLQDVLTRWKRMEGFEALWLPGSDHASIATEVKVVEKIKKEEGKSKEELGREEFLKRAWKWKEEYGGRIVDQEKDLQWMRAVTRQLRNSLLIYITKDLFTGATELSTGVRTATQHCQTPRLNMRTRREIITM